MVRNQRLRFIAILVSGAVGVALIAGLWLWENRFFGIDACLDSGGCWNYEANECEHVDQNQCLHGD